MAKKKKSSKKIELTPEEVTKDLLKRWGSQVVTGEDMRTEDRKAISTGSMKLDFALTKPFVEGTINEIYAYEGAGKTTMALEVAAQATQMGKYVFFFDLERKLVKSQLDMIPRIKRELFFRVRPDNGEDAVNKVLDCVNEFPGCVVIFDSLTQLLPEVEDAEDAGSLQMGAVARLAAKMVRKILGPIERNRCMALFISHITTNMNPYAAGDTTKGGRAVRDASAQRVKLKSNKSDRIKDADGNIVGQMTHCEVIKNNQGVPNMKVEVPIVYGKGVDRALDLLQIARDLAVVEYGGGWYKYYSKDTPEGKSIREAELLDIIRKDKEYRDSVIEQVKQFL